MGGIKFNPVDTNNGNNQANSPVGGFEKPNSAMTQVGALYQEIGNTENTRPQNAGGNLDISENSYYGFDKTYNLHNAANSTNTKKITIDSNQYPLEKDGKPVTYPQFAGQTTDDGRTYDNQGNLVSYENGDYKKSYEYNGNKLLSETINLGETSCLKTTYDDNGSVTSESYENKELNYSTQTDYHKDGSITHVTKDGLDTYKVAYNADGRLISEENNERKILYNDDGSTTEIENKGNGTLVTNKDSEGHITSGGYKGTGDSDNDYHFDCTYNEDGSIATYNENNKQGTKNIVCDSQGRVLSEKFASNNPFTESYETTTTYNNDGSSASTQVFEDGRSITSSKTPGFGQLTVYSDGTVAVNQGDGATEDSLVAPLVHGQHYYPSNTNQVDIKVPQSDYKLLDVGNVVRDGAQLEIYTNDLDKEVIDLSHPVYSEGTSTTDIECVN